MLLDASGNKDDELETKLQASNQKRAERYYKAPRREGKEMGENFLNHHHYALAPYYT